MQSVKDLQMPYLLLTFAAEKKVNMARPIKETPTLTGKDARAFDRKINNPRPVTQAEIKAARESYNRVKSIAKFVF